MIQIQQSAHGQSARGKAAQPTHQRGRGGTRSEAPTQCGPGGTLLAVSIGIMGWAAAVLHGWGQAGTIDFNFSSPREDVAAVRGVALGPDGTILVAGLFDSSDVSLALIRLKSNGDPDMAFSPVPGWGTVNAVALQADGKILIGGPVGISSEVLQHGIGRLNPDGTPDGTFNPGLGVSDNYVQTIAVQPNQQILIAGAFQRVGGSTRINIARLNPNGSVDPGFVPGTGGDGPISSVAVQPDGKIVIAGYFQNFRGVARLNGNGTLDGGFVSRLEAGSSGLSLVVQPDGKIVVSGRVLVGGVNRGIARLNTDGSIDSGFNPGTGISAQSNAVVSALALQADGRILAGGFFNFFNGVGADHLVRLNADGTLDRDYDPGTFHDTVEPSGNFGSITVQTLAVQSDGKAIVGGSFGKLAGVSRQGVLRLLGGENPGYGGRFQFGAANYSISETGGLAVINVVRTRSSNGVASVSFSAGAGGHGFNSSPAADGIDFVVQAGALSFADGQTSATFTVPIVDDQLGELTENVGLALNDPSGGAVLGRPGVATLAILENDTAFTVWMWPDNATALESTGSIEFWVLRQGLLNGTASVRYATGSGTAAPGQDYTPRSGLLTFTNGEGIMRVSVPILNDQLTEGDETFHITLSDPSPGTFLNPGSDITVTIADDDDDGPGSVISNYTPSFQADFTVPSVNDLVLRPDGDLVVAGAFNQVNGRPRRGVARLDSSGLLDLSFVLEPDLVAQVLSLAVASDESVVLGGIYFSGPHEFLQSGLVRLAPDGSLDTNFNAAVEQGGIVYDVAGDGAGGWLLAGGFFEIGGTNRTGLARINSTGQLDQSFRPILQAENGRPWVGLLATHADGGVYIVGYFSSVNGVSRPGFARLKADGSLDETFVPDGLSFSGIESLVAQPDGKVLVAGSFTGAAQHPRAGLIRLAANGSLDQSFYPVAVDPGASFSSSGRIKTAAVQSDGRIVIAGNFRRVNGLTRMAMARLRPDGALDAAFDTTGFYEASVQALAIEPNGDVVAGGYFRFLNGSERTLVRLRGENPAFPGRFELATPSHAVWETNGSILLSVTRTGNATGPASIQLVVTDGTASNGVDYAFSEGPIEFQGGEATKVVTIALRLDNLIEPPETFQVRLKSPVGGVLGSSLMATFTILDHPGGVLDETFSSTTGLNDDIYSLEWAPGEKIFALGRFNEQPGFRPRSLVRFIPDGSFDFGFAVEPESDAVEIAPTGDGRLYVSGGIGFSAAVIRRLADGSLDRSFESRYGVLASPLVAMADGSLVFNSRTEIPMPFPGETFRSNHIVRVKDDGSVDSRFNPHLAVEGYGVSQLALQADGKILVVGTFSRIGGIVRSNLARLHPDGSVDLEFSPEVPAGALSQIVVQPDGKLLLGGSFRNINGVDRIAVARLLANGAVDPSFQSPFHSDQYVWRLAVQGDGKILATGYSLSRGGMIRLDETGGVDPSFDPDFSFSGIPWSILVQGDGRVLAGGGFSEVNGVARRGLVRLLNDPGIGAGRLEFLTNAVSISETTASVTLSVRRTGGTRGAISANFGTGLGNATADDDFDFTSGFIRFEDGETGEKPLTVTLHDDLRAEGEEHFFVNLLNPLGGATLGQNASVAVTIRDNDTALEFAEALFREREDQTVRLISVRRRGSLMGAVSAHFTTQDVTARAARDYFAQECTLQFAEGETNVTLALVILEDEEAEVDETLRLILSDPGGGALLGTNAGVTFTILDNDRPGTVDLEFEPGLGLFPGSIFNGGGVEVESIVIQSDGRILVAGEFYGPFGSDPAGVIRLTSDGSMDWSFAPGGMGDQGRIVQRATRMALQPDGKVLVAADDFETALWRLDANGWLDPGFHCAPNHAVYAIVVQPDGNVLIGGAFTQVNGVPTPGVARLKSDGSVDREFDPGTGVQIEFEGEQYSGNVYAVVPQADGRILIGGEFNLVNGITRRGFARLLENGVMDPSFDPGSGFDRDNFASVGCLAIDTNGRILAGGSFYYTNGVQRMGLARFHPDGLIDSGFEAYGFQQWFGYTPTMFVLQNDGRLLVTGYFGGEGIDYRVGLTRLGSSGVIDPNFDPQFQFQWGQFGFRGIRALAVQPDEQILVGGAFTAVDGVERQGLARLNGGVFDFEFRSIARLAGGRTRLTFAMPRGQAYVLESSEGMVNWEQRNPTQLLRNQAEFIDGLAPSAGRRFYRAVRLP